MRPLVSVMIPCFQAEGTLELALASVRAQTAGDLECLCLDDGSTDRTWTMLSEAAVRDRRFRIERSLHNRGRGAARKRLLEQARGEYLVFLDADDWMYPQRIERELAWLALDRRIAAVSAAAAVTNGPDELVGLMRPGGAKVPPIVAYFGRPAPPPLLFPTTMIRTEHARRAGFDAALRRSQDSDMLIRALLGRHYALIPDVLYAYSQGSAATLEKTLEGYRYRIRAHLKHLAVHPVRVTRTVGETLAKMAIFRVAGELGFHHHLIARRWGATDAETTAGFCDALRAVQRARCEFFA